MISFDIMIYKYIHIIVSQWILFLILWFSTSQEKKSFVKRTSNERKKFMECIQVVIKQKKAIAEVLYYM